MERWRPRPESCQIAAGSVLLCVHPDVFLLAHGLLNTNAYDELKRHPHLSPAQII